MTWAERRRPMPLTIIGLLLALGLPELGLARYLPDPRIGREIVWITLGVFVLVWTTQVERLPLASIGFRRPAWTTLGWGLAAAMALIATVMLTYAVIAPAFGLHQNMAKTAAIVQVPLWLMLLTPVVAGVTEEIVYRGYTIERLAFLTGNRPLAGILSAFVFLFAHLSWGPTQMVLVAFACVILTTLYLWRRDLWCTIIAHVLADLIGFALARAQM